MAGNRAKNTDYGRKTMPKTRRALNLFLRAGNGSNILRHIMSRPENTVGTIVKLFGHIKLDNNAQQAKGDDKTSDILKKYRCPFRPFP